MDFEYQIAQIVKNEEVKQALLQFLISRNETQAKSDDYYVYCAKMYNIVDSCEYFHPIIVPRDMTQITSVESLLNHDAYTMAAGKNQFEVRDKYIGMINAGTKIYNIECVLVHIDQETFERLQTALTELLNHMLQDVRTIFDAIDAITRRSPMIRGNTEFKVKIMNDLFHEMMVTSTCLDRNLCLHDCADHDYTQSNTDEDDDDSCYDNDEYGYDEDDDERCNGDCDHCGYFDCEFANC